nr:fructose-bisphosphatase class II family protein [Succinivibrionaceae bacterium]
HALGKPVSELNVFVLDKPRHRRLVQDIRVSGAKVLLHADGDVAGALMAVDSRSDIDLLMGTGGTPETIITACAIKGSGGQMLTRLDPQSDEERRMVEADGIDLSAIRSLDDLVRGEECFFAGTGVTPGELLGGVRYRGSYAVTHSLTTRGKTGTWRYIEAWHNLAKLQKMSSIRY